MFIFQFSNKQQEFWNSVMVDKCRKYIGHLPKALPIVVALRNIE